MPALKTPATHYQLDQLIDELSQLPTYTIGRSAANAIVIADSKVSGQHARLIQCTPDSFVLEDTNSKNGVFVNDVRITRKVVDRTDTVRLADAHVTVAQLLNLRQPALDRPVAVQPPQPVHKIPEPESVKNPLDFTEPFAGLKVVYEQYPKLRKDCRNREKMVRTGSIILSSVVGVSTVVATGGGAAVGILLHLMSGAGLSMLLPTLCSTLLSTEEKLEIIDKEYRERYRCPNPACRDPFGTREWDLLAQQKTCRRCKAIWVA